MNTNFSMAPRQTCYTLLALCAFAALARADKHAAIAEDAQDCAGFGTSQCGEILFGKYS